MRSICEFHGAGVYYFNLPHDEVMRLDIGQVDNITQIGI